MAPVVGKLLKKWIKQYKLGRIRQNAICTLETSFFEKLENYDRQTDIPIESPRRRLKTQKNRNYSKKKQK